MTTKKRGQNEGSIYYDAKRGRWTGAVVLPDGKRKVFRAVTRAEVSRKVAQTILHLEQGIAPPSARLTVGAFLDAWLKTHAELRGLRYATRRGYEQIIRLHLVPHIGKITLAKLGPDDVEKMLAAMKEQGLSARTRQYAHAVLRVALRSALRDGKVYRNVAALVDAPSVRREPVKPFDVEEAKVFLWAAKKDELLGPLYTVTLGLGLRKGEVLGLKWSDVDLDEGSVWIRRALQRHKGVGLVTVDPKSRTSVRPLALPPFVVDAFREQRRRQAEQRLAFGPGWRDEDWVFTMEDGRPVSPDLIDKRFPAFLEKTPYTYCGACKAAILDDTPPAVCPHCGQKVETRPLRRVRFHDLRHSCASLLFAQGCPLRLVMEILGHSQIALTANTYTHLYAEANREAAAAMQTLLTPKP